MAMATDLPSTFDERSCIKLVGFDMARKAASKAYEHRAWVRKTWT